MSLLPKPRNIRRAWRSRPIEPKRAAAELSIRFGFIDTYGTPIEARAWEVARGWRKGFLKRVDVLFDDDGHVRAASLRLSAGKAQIRLGKQAAV